MKLAFALLTENAALLQDGRLAIFGGDFDTIENTELPFVAPVVVVAKFEIDVHEPADGHTFAVDIELPSGDRAPGAEIANLRFDANSNLSDLPRGTTVIARLLVNFEQAGIHYFHLIANDKEAGRLPLFVKIASTPEPKQ